ncbi:hypothetical protein [Amycolatopsis echigonensis]|uniref:Uncharacterized protein n=1 Tax=Amycolatopsis echigonensis TaxID=2576905 RepID=A0A8E1W8T9_9PSEU|nr:hypothetical protein [Amycolatopsis echigonensis]MBB2506017.1 hypothetical protein [Amycolatopsis echigonensis]
MKQPLCSNTSDGECPNFALNGIESCLVHAPIARDNFGFTIDIGYRPGHVVIDEYAEIAKLLAEPDEPNPPVLPSMAWTAPPPLARRRGWLSALAGVFR